MERQRKTTRNLAKEQLESAVELGLELKGAYLLEDHLEGAYLRGAHLERANLRRAHLERADLRGTHLEGANLRGAHLERADLRGTHLEGANLREARLKGADLEEAHLEGADLSEAHLEEAHLYKAQLKEAYLIEARLKEAYLGGAKLERANLREAQLERANLREAQLKGANLRKAQLKGANLSEAHLEWTDLSGARLEGADLRGARLEGTNLSGARLEGTNLSEVTLGNKILIGPRLADVQWGTSNLAVVDWSQGAKLGDEWETVQKTWPNGRKKQTQERLNDFRAAVRANRQLAVALQAQGLSEEASRFAYRAQRLQRIVLRQQKKIGQYLFSNFLDLLAGYGYKPGRSVIAYLLIIFGFMIFYLLNARLVAPHLSWDEALVLSVSSFHGRGFFSQDISLGDTYARLAAAEAVIGLIIEISFIATFTQRFFGK